MLRLMIMAQESKALTRLCSELIGNGLTCSVISNSDGLMEQIATQSPDLLLVETNGDLVNSRIRRLTKKVKEARPLPIIALIARETLDSINDHHNIDDFLISPYDADELILRAKRLLHNTKITDNDELILCEGLVIDLAKCEVTVEGKVVELTFKEYELLKFLANNKGRVHTREALLNSVWGYDYYGGDRTVDVHLRRLRGKIEDSKHNFIETVRNIGYRFKEHV